MSGTILCFFRDLNSFKYSITIIDETEELPLSRSVKLYGQKITRLAEYATNQFLPLTLVCTSKGKDTTSINTLFNSYSDGLKQIIVTCEVQQWSKERNGSD